MTRRLLAVLVVAAAATFLTFGLSGSVSSRSLIVSVNICC